MFYPNLNLYLSIKFKYKPGINHGSAILKVKNKKVSCAFDIDFETARHSYLIVGTRHPNTPPKRKTNPYDSLTTIKDLDTLIRRIEYIFHVEELDDLIESFIRNSFIKKYIEKRCMQNVLWLAKTICIQDKIKCYNQFAQRVLLSK